MKRKMKAWVLHKPYDMRLENVNVPRIGSNEVLIGVRSVGICGSDVHYYTHGRVGSYVVKEPIILGHECSGEIFKVGKDVSRLEVGQRVTVEPGFFCGKCRYCIEGRYNLCRNMRFYATPPVNGAFAEFVSAPAENVFPLPDGMSYEEGALIEPLAVGMMAAKRGSITPHDSVAVLGAGPIGQMILQAAKASGAVKTYVTDILDYRLDYARRLGASFVFNSDREDVVQRILDLTHGDGVDVVVDASGSPSAIQQAFRIVRPGGRIVLVGIYPALEIRAPLGYAIDKELDIRGVFRYANMYSTAIQLVSMGRIDVKSLITHTFPFEKLPDGFETYIGKIGDPMKIMISIGDS